MFDGPEVDDGENGTDGVVLKGTQPDVVELLLIDVCETEVNESDGLLWHEVITIKSDPELVESRFEKEKFDDEVAERGSCRAAVVLERDIELKCCWVSPAMERQMTNDHYWD